jgi:hypothetical protein
LLWESLFFSGFSNQQYLKGQVQYSSWNIPSLKLAETCSGSAFKKNACDPQHYSKLAKKNGLSDNLSVIAINKAKQA